MSTFLWVLFGFWVNAVVGILVCSFLDAFYYRGRLLAWATEGGGWSYAFVITAWPVVILWTFLDSRH